MKSKAAAIIAAGIMSISLVACGVGNNPTTDIEEDSEQENDTSEETQVEQENDTSEETQVEQEKEISEEARAYAEQVFNIILKAAKEDDNGLIVDTILNMDFDILSDYKEYSEPYIDAAETEEYTKYNSVEVNDYTIEFDKFTITMQTAETIIEFTYVDNPEQNVSTDEVMIIIEASGDLFDEDDLEVVNIEYRVDTDGMIYISSNYRHLYI